MKLNEVKTELWARQLLLDLSKVFPGPVMRLSDKTYASFKDETSKHSPRVSVTLGTSGGETVAHVETSFSKPLADEIDQVLRAKNRRFARLLADKDLQEYYFTVYQT